MHGPEFYDHNIKAINKSDATIIVQKGKEYRTIDLNVCAENFKRNYSSANGSCVGDRNINNKYFFFQTSGIGTMISFKRLYVFNFFGNRLFHGTRTQRFLQLQKVLTDLGFTTYDMT